MSETLTKPAGYTYKAENYCPLAAAHTYIEDQPHVLVTHGSIDAVRALGGDLFETLAVIAEERGIDYGDPESYDSDSFPKPFTASQAEPDEFCGHCLVRFSDGAQLKAYTVLGIEFPDGTQMATHVIAGYVPDDYMAGAGDADDFERWTAHITAPTQDEAVAKAVSMATDGPDPADEPGMIEKEYGAELAIGQHTVTSWGPRVEDNMLINSPAVQVEYADVQVMIYSSVIDGRVVVEATNIGDASYRVVADGTDPVYVNYGPQSED